MCMSDYRNDTHEYEVSGTNNGRKVDMMEE